MEKRKEKLLLSIINEYIKNAAPVASKMLAGRGGFKLSSATLRNEMAELEEEGMIFQPHTSAGRIPTEAGFNFYLEQLKSPSNSPFGKGGEIAGKEKKELERAARTAEFPEKSLAKVLAELSDEAVILAFGKNDVYYTGLSNLFAKPEFHDQDLVYRIGEVVDHLDEIINEIFEETKEEIKILIGKKNPFSESCGAVVSRYCGKNKKAGLVAVLGPIRMDYGKNIALVREVKDLLNKI
jgi:transcriptional regulator of heat shock response